MQSTLDALETDAVAIERNIKKLTLKDSDEDLQDLLYQAQNAAHKLASILRRIARTLS